MIIPLLGAIIGALTGALIARRRKGTTTDILHYTVVYALAFGLFGLFAVLIISRFMV